MLPNIDLSQHKRANTMMGNYDAPGTRTPMSYGTPMKR